jgi:hypothetical protein
LVSESTASIMRITIFVPAGSVPFAITGGAVEATSGRITFSERRSTGRSLSTSLLELEPLELEPLELEPSARRSVG